MNVHLTNLNFNEKDVSLILPTHCRHSRAVSSYSRAAARKRRLVLLSGINQICTLSDDTEMVKQMTDCGTVVANWSRGNDWNTRWEIGREFVGIVGQRDGGMFLWRSVEFSHSARGEGNGAIQRENGARRCHGITVHL